MAINHENYMKIHGRFFFPLLSGVMLWGGLLGAITFSPSAYSALKLWTGSANGNFNSSFNWSPSGAPVAGDDLVFQPNNLVAQLLVTNDFSPNRAFNSLTFQGSNYFVRGNPILLTNGITAVNTVGANHIDADVEVRASQNWEGTGSLGVLDVNGDINLNTNTLTVRANTADFFFSGVISGTGNLVKTNVGTLRMDGIGHNTYSGFTRFDGGVLELDKFSTVPASNYVAIPGDLTIGDGNGLVGTDVLRLLADDQIADTSDVTVKNSGRFDLNDRNDRIGSLTMQGGTIDSGTGTLILGGNLTTISDPNTAVISGHLSLGGSTRTFTVGAGAPLRINAILSDGVSLLFSTAGFTKTGAGVLTLAATNTYNGLTSINDGQVVLLTDGALGDVTSLFGSAATVINGSGNLFLSNVQVTNEDLTINSTNASQALGASGSSVWTGDITLNADTQIASSGTLLLNGAITGVGGYTKTSTGTLTLGGTNRNTYSGTTTVRDGTLFLDKDTSVVVDGAMSGPLVIGEDELPENTDIVRYLHSSQLPDDTDVTINASGLLDLNGFGENIHDLILNGGDVSTGAAGSLLPTGDITASGNTNSVAVISGRLSVLSNPIINVTGHFFSPDLRIDAQLHGTGGFTKNGVGELDLTSSNIFTGPVTVNEGFVEVDDSFALGTTNGGVVVNAGAVLALRFGVDVGAEPLTLAGTGQFGFGALSSSFGSNSWAGNITLSSNATVSVETNNFLYLSGSISNNFDITKTSPGTLIFGGNTFNDFRNLFINAGTNVFDKTIANASGPSEITLGDGSGTDTLRLDRDNQIPDSTPIHMRSPARFDMNDMIDTVGSIDGTGTIDLGSGTLHAGADNGSTNFNGAIIGTGTLFKFGTGTWTLNGNNTYAGSTTVSAGTLVVNGSQPLSDVTVNGTGNLGGNGTVGNLHVFGNLRPGGILTSSNVLFDAAADYFVDINGSNPGVGGYDQLNVRGTNNLNGSTLHVSVDPNFAPTEGEAFTILNNDGAEAIVGTFNGLPNGSVLTAGGLQFRIVYSDIFLNDVILVVTNTALKVGATPLVDTGNGNGDIEPGECNQLRIPLMNKLAGIVSGVSATLSSTNPGVIITHPFSSYPNLPANGMRTNTTPFQISTSPGLLCGTNIDLVLTVHTATNGNFSVPLTVFTGTAGPSLRFDRTGDQAIPDLGTLDSTIAVGSVGTPIHHVVVSLHLSHTVDDNLDISLIAPDGTTIDLSSDNGGTLDDYGTSCLDAGRTTFSDAAAVAITAGTAPFVGTFQPESPLSVLRGKSGIDVNGTWRLRIADDTAGGVGTLHCWSLIIFPTICTPGGGQCEECSGGPFVGSITNTDAVQTDRLTRISPGSVCESNKPCPGTTTAGAIHYDAYSFTNIGPASCVTVTLNTPCNSTVAGGDFIHSSAYLVSYNSANKCLNYLGDIGNSPNPEGSYSFNIPSSSQFVVIVNETGSGLGCTNYTLNVTGFECPTALAIARDLTRSNSVVLTWSTANPGYDRISTNALKNPPNAFSVVTPPPVVVNGKFTVTNNPAGATRFYELRKP